MTHAQELVPPPSFRVGLLTSINLVQVVPKKHAQRLTSETTPHMCAGLLDDSRFYQVGKLLTIQFTKKACTSMTLYKWRLSVQILDIWGTRETHLCLSGNRNVCKDISPMLSVILEQLWWFRDTLEVAPPHTGLYYSLSNFAGKSVCVSTKPILWPSNVGRGELVQILLSYSKSSKPSGASLSSNISVWSHVIRLL